MATSDANPAYGADLTKIQFIRLAIALCMGTLVECEYRLCCTVADQGGWPVQCVSSKSPARDGELSDDVSALWMA